MMAREASIIFLKVSMSATETYSCQKKESTGASNSSFKL